MFHTTHSKLLVFFTTIICLVFTNADASSQATLIKTITQLDIEQRIQAIKDKQNLSSDVKARVLALYAECLDNLNEAHAMEEQADAFKKSMITLPFEAKQLSRQLADADATLKNRKQEKFALFPTDELEQRLIIEKARLSDLDEEISRIDSQLNDYLNRPQIVREKISAIKSKQTLSQQEQQTLSSRNIDNTVEKEALQMRLETRSRLLNATLKTFELENISDPLRLQVLKDRKSLLSFKREQLSLLIADLDNFLLDRRQQVIDKEQAELIQAEKAAEGKHPLIQAATRENMAYSRNLQEVTKNMEQFIAQKNELDVRFKQVEKDYHSAEQKINLAGLSPALGNLLREQRRNLPQRKQFSDLNEQIQSEIAKTSLETFKLDDAKKILTDVGQDLLNRMDQLAIETTDADKLKIRTELRMLLNDQQDLVIRLSSLYNEYARVLGDVDFSLQQMLSIAEEFSAYLDQRLLWVPSAPVIDKYYISEIVGALYWFISPTNWQQVLLSFWRSISVYPLLALAGPLTIVCHWYLKDKARRRLNLILPVKGLPNRHVSNLNKILQALVDILILSLTWPIVMIWFAGVLMLAGKNEVFTHAFILGLISASISLTVALFFYRLFKPQGIAEYLFQWQAKTTQLFFFQIKWSRFVLVPSIFMVAMTTGSDVFSQYSFALGRIALIIMMLALMFVFHRVTHPKSGLGKLFYPHAHGWRQVMLYLLYVLALSLPIIIIGFAVAGYYLSALELEQKLLFSLRLVFVTVLCHELAQRWLVITQRKLALQNARQRRKHDDQVINHTDVNYNLDVSLLDISKINQQSHKLLTMLIFLMVLFGLWIIWRDILTAFAVFDRIELWQHSLMVDGKESVQPVTLTNLLFSLAYASIAFVVVSNFPALVDLLLIDKLEMTPGSRYALIQLTRYLLISIAFLLIANELGGSWSQVQWLVAALSVGLGFGLQEIFANMVSGIILLFERPIRVGDTVTVGNVTGRVSRIQMRATHIVDWDRKELVVPNKIFITGQLINWTLSDTVTRLVIPLGVAYGVDVDEVVRVLMEAIHKTAMVLPEPEASVVFSGFGESALLFNIHVFVHELTDRIAVKHELHKNIYEALQANHIEIPFPQTEVHLRTMAVKI